MPIAITKENYEKEVSQATVPVLIDVYANWCGPCQQMMPIVEEIEKELTSHKFVKINVDECRELAIQLGVTSIPTFIFMKSGTVKGKEVGYLPKDDLKEKIKKYLG